MILVSTCLLGLNTKYDGGHNFSQSVVILGKSIQFTPVCPEQLGGLPTPRPPAEIQGGGGCDVLAGEASVVTRAGSDNTEAFLRGARETLKLAAATGVVAALLKSYSPSCGNCRVYDGSFSGTKRDGAGVAAALLIKNGIPVFNEQQLDDLKEFLVEKKF